MFDTNVNPYSDGRRLAGKKPALSMVLLVIAGLLIPAWAGAAASRGEYEVKAAFLLNFARLVKWPAGALPADDSPIVVGVLGAEPFESAMKEGQQARPAGTHPVEIRQLTSSQDVSGCHIVFVTDGQAELADAVVRAASGRNVLTVGESSNFAATGGVITFFMEDKKLRFEINTRAADSAGLEISSRLLRLAKITK